MAKKELLIVDGYNVIHKSNRYIELIDTPTTDVYCTDVMVKARDKLVGDVSAYAQGKCDAVVVFDGAKNVSPQRAPEKVAGISVLYSSFGQSADSVIEELVKNATNNNQKVLLVTSDNTIRFTAGLGIAKISADIFISNMNHENTVSVTKEDVNQFSKMTISDRLDDKTRQKLQKLLSSK